MAAISIAATLTTSIGLTIGPSTLLAIQLPAARAAADRVAALWRETGPGSGAFAPAASLDPPLDLYASSWNLRLASTYRLALPKRLDAGRLADALRGVLEDPGTVDAMPRLEALRLAASALHDLGASTPRELIATRLAEVRAGTGYAFAAGGPSTVAALAAAIRTMSLAGVSVPGEVTTEIRVQLARSAGGATIQELADTTIPAWIAADAVLAADERSAALPRLSVQLDALWSAVAGANTWDGPTLSLVADSIDVARANGLAIPSFDPEFWAPLERDDGYLLLALQSTEADPQATEAAARSGRPLDPQLTRTLASAAGPLGWQSVSIGGPMDSAMAVPILARMNVDAHGPEVAQQSIQWLATLRSDITDAESLRSSLASLAAYNRLAGLLGVPRWMPPLASWNVDVSGWRPSEQHWLARAYLLSGEPVPGSIVTALVAASDRAPTSVEDALGISLVGTLTNHPEFQGRIGSFLATVETGGLYAKAPGSASPDLRSTAIAYALQGRTSIDAARRFATTAGFGLLPDPGSSRSNGIAGPALPDALDARSAGQADAPGSLETTFLAFGLATGVDNLAALP